MIKYKVNQKVKRTSGEPGTFPHIGAIGIIDSCWKHPEREGGQIFYIIHFEGYDSPLIIIQEELSPI